MMSSSRAYQKIYMRQKRSNDDIEEEIRNRPGKAPIKHHIPPGKGTSRSLPRRASSF